MIDTTQHTQHREQNRQHNTQVRHTLRQRFTQQHKHTPLGVVN